MAKQRDEVPALSPAQQEIMEIVWDRGEISAWEVRQTLCESRPVARNTVRTMLERMEEKGWLTHREVGRTFIYSAAQPRETTVRQKVIEVLEGVCGGSPEELVSALLDCRSLTANELNRIRQLLNDTKARAISKKRS